MHIIEPSKHKDSIQSNLFNISSSHIPVTSHNNSLQTKALPLGYALNFNYVRKHIKGSTSVEGHGCNSTTISTTRFNATTQRHERYQRPYPGYAFEFGHIDSYRNSKEMKEFEQIMQNTNKSVSVENVDGGQYVQKFIPTERIYQRGGVKTGAKATRNLDHQLSIVDKQISESRNSSHMLSENHNFMISRQKTLEKDDDTDEVLISEPAGRMPILPKIKFKIVDDAHVNPQNMTQRTKSHYQQELENISQRLSQPSLDRFAYSQHMGKRFDLISPKGIKMYNMDNNSVFTPREKKLAPLNSSRTKQPGPVALHQQQKYKVNKNRVDYQYIPKKGEFTETMFSMSPDNKYHEGTNPLVQRFINSVQGNIKVSNKCKVNMKNQSQKIFDLMKKEKHRYIKTLVKGEDEGHCKGIKKRLDPTIKINLKQEQDKYERIQQERLEKVQQDKKQRDKENLIKSRQRIQEKMNILNQHTTTLTKKEREGGPNAFLQSFQKTVLKSNLKQKQLAVLFNSSPLQTSRQSMAIRPPSQRGTGVVQFQIDDDDLRHQRPMAQIPIEIELLVNDQANTNIHSPQPAFMDEDLIDMDQLRFNQRLHPIPEQSTEGGTISASGTSSLGKKSISGSLKNNGSKSALANMKRSTIITQGLNVQKYVTDEQKRTIDKLCQWNPDSVCNRLFYHYRNEQIAQQSRSEKNKTPGGGSNKKKPILAGYKSLGISEDPGLQHFFKGMCESDVSIKHAGLKKVAYKQFLQERYSRQVGEKILAFMESEYQSFYNIGFNSFLNVLADFLNDGPDTYRKMLFDCLSLSNPGRICEHDIFTLLEQFKQRESFFFYQDLIAQQDVPRDYQKINDKSDQVFFDVFAKDVKKLSKIINLKKRMMGIQDFDTVNGIESDFSFENYPGTQQQYDEDIINQINYIVEVIVRSFSGQSREDKEYNFAELMDIILNAQSLQDLRNTLCEKCNKSQLLSQTQSKRPGSSMSNSTHMSGNQSVQGIKEKPLPSLSKNSSQASTKDLKVSSHANPNHCLGHNATNKDPRKKITECISITYRDFKKLMGPKSEAADVPGLAADFIKVMTLDMINLHNFERTMAHYRDIGGFNGTLVKKKIPEPLSPKPPTKLDQSARDTTNNFGRQCTSKRQTITSTVKKNITPAASVAVLDEPIKLQYVPKHTIQEPYTIKDHYAGGEFAGKIMIKQLSKTKKKTGALLLDGFVDQDMDGQDPDLVMIIPGEQIRELHSFKEHFGPENFFNIFKCFYTLCEIGPEVENNVFQLYIDQASMIRGFDTVFGVDIEEVAIRFFNLFIEPPDKPKVQKIDINRFYYVVQQICYLQNDSSHIQMAFRFYDYDNNQNIGSVDIVNLIKFLPALKVDKIYQKQLSLLKYRTEKKAQYLKDMSKKKTRAKLDQIDTEDEKKDSDEESSEDETISDSDRSTNNNKEINVENLDKTDDKIKEKPKKRPPSSMTVDSKEAEQIKHRKMLADRFKKRDVTYKSHMNSNQLSNKWNKVLFEVKLLRNYFVDQAVLPAQKSLISNPNFLNVKRFEQKFVNQKQEKFHLDMPAIIFFFRERFICKSSTKTQAYGSSMFLESTGSTMALYTYKMGSNLNLQGLLLDMGYGKQTNEFLQMVETLQSCSTIPRMLNVE